MVRARECVRASMEFSREDSRRKHSMKRSWSYGFLLLDAKTVVISARRVAMCSGWRPRATIAHVSALDLC
jgi:hypothetical protein